MQPSPLQLLRCNFESVNVTAVPEFSNEQRDANLATPLQTLHMTSETAVQDLDSGDGWADYAIRFQLSFEPQEAKTSPYRGALSLQAVVRMHGGATALERKQMAVVNGVSLIYGVARDMVCTITSRAVHGQLLLPTLNFRTLAQQVTPEASSIEEPKPVAKQKTTRRKTKAA